VVARTVGKEARMSYGLVVQVSSEVVWAEEASNKLK